MTLTPRPELRIPAALLRFYRLRAVLTQEQLAEKSDVAVARIRQIESGRNNIVRPDTVNKLADAMGCQPSDISEVTGHPDEAAV